MITVLVKFKISNELNLKTLKEKFIETSTLYVDVEGLLRKNYIADIEKGYAGGVYTFTKKQSSPKNGLMKKELSGSLKDTLNQKSHIMKVQLLQIMKKIK